MTNAPDTVTYSGCSCTKEDACTGTCDAATECVPNGSKGPYGTALSKPFTAKQGEDYNISFDMYVGLNPAEGQAGFLESFTVKLVTEAKSNLEPLATMVCHATECDVGQASNPNLADPCKSGVNFQYPGCSDPKIPPSGDYGKWIHYSFKLSDLICGTGGSIQETFINTVNAIPCGGNPDPKCGTKDFQPEAKVAIWDHSYNCGQGLMIDNLVIAKLCSGWPETCSQ